MLSLSEDIAMRYYSHRDVVNLNLAGLLYKRRERPEMVKRACHVQAKIKMMQALILHVKGHGSACLKGSRTLLKVESR